VKHSEDTAAAFREAGIEAVSFDGNTPAEERKRIVADYRAGRIKILCNVDLISEGFDCPDCSCCILLRPTLSTALFIQQSMRALRPQPGKTAVILDHVNNYQRHGLPDDDREWSLTSAIKPKSRYGEDGKLLIRQCPRCYYTYRSAPVCPNCGYKTELTREEIKNVKEIRLEEIKQRGRDKAKEVVKEKESINDCKNMFEIMAWCKENGKKPGYGYYHAKARGLLRAK
jgi:superfamily II DNA or RNA helicase